jgi:glyoxylase-like metal-dependent hydrolase (beta-lactamase superfamily II)
MFVQRSETRVLQVLTVETPGLGDRSYLVHDGRAGLVVDPQRDIDRILSAAGGAGVTITHVAETHVHNDYVTGGLELSRLLGVPYLVAAAEEVSFERSAVSDGDEIEAGPCASTSSPRQVTLRTTCPTSSVRRERPPQRSPVGRCFTARSVAPT